MVTKLWAFLLCVFPFVSGWICPNEFQRDPPWRRRLSGYSIDTCMMVDSINNGGMRNRTNICGHCDHDDHTEITTTISPHEEVGFCAPVNPIKREGAVLHCDCNLEMAPRQDLDANTFWHLHLFLGYEYIFHCGGYVETWEFYASYTGTVHFGVWRLNYELTEWELVGKNTYTASTVGLHTFNVPLADQIYAWAYDVIGIHYPASVVANQGVVASETTTDSWFLSFDMRDNVLPVGTTVAHTDPSETVFVFPAVKAIMGHATRTFQFNKPNYDFCKCQFGCYYSQFLINWNIRLGCPLVDCSWNQSEPLPMWADDCVSFTPCETGGQSCGPVNPVVKTYTFYCEDGPRTARVRSFSSCGCQ